MKQFLKFTLASMTGLILGSIVLFFLTILIIGGIVASAGKGDAVEVENNSILHVKFDGEIKERSSDNPFSDFMSGLSGEKSIGLDAILKGLEDAKTDDNIKGIFIDVTNIPAGMAMVEEIRNKLNDFKSSGKFILAYSEYFSQSGYYLASVADKIYLNPQGAIDFKGFSAQLVFFKNTLDKLELDAQVIRHGKFKAAVEPFLLTEMSEANRLQTRTYVSSMWQHMLDNISESRNLSKEHLQMVADSLLIRIGEDAVTYKLADKLAYKDEVLEELRSRTDAESVDELNTITLSSYHKAEKKSKDFAKDKIAVVYAVGDIESGEGDNETIGSERISKAIRDARMDDKVKAIVLRVNSPGGSALASEVIWREVVLAKKEKPVIVSMGNLAASGGYYIACGADTIVAEPNTITGSIGVFGVLLNAKDFFNNKIGVTFDTVKTATYADFGSIARPLTTPEYNIIQKSVENVYDVFITRVSEGRGISKEMVDSIGQGRVWSGIDAKRIGLVDVLGGMDTALEIAARKAGLNNYRIQNFPKQENPLAKFFGEIEDEASTRFMKNEMGESYKYYQQVKKISNYQGIQARMPYEPIVY